MKLFTCAHCGNRLFFYNRICVSCGARLGFSPLSLNLHAVEPAGGDLWQAAGHDEPYRFCANAATDVCNWLIPADQPDAYCRACRHNRLVPNDLDRFRHITDAQHRLFYAFLKWDLPAPDRHEDPQGGLVFDYLEDAVTPDGRHHSAMTGHDEGVISIRAAEADETVRESVRTRLGEPYRTLVGHFRHECGHFIWNRLVRDQNRLEACRAVFGDERTDYQTAIERHYREGPPPGWGDDYISAYATMHPWEDFAESFAHVLHITDALETAYYYGMKLDLRDQTATVDFKPYHEQDFGKLADAWVPLSLALNSIHSAMGERPFYPFLLTPRVVGKLSFVHRLITGQTV